MHWYRIRYTLNNELPIFPDTPFRMYADDVDAAIAEFWQRMTVTYGDGVKSINLISIRDDGECDKYDWRRELGIAP